MKAKQITYPRIVPDKKYPNMYRIEFDKDTISVRSDNPPVDMGPYGIYNKTRAKELLFLLKNKELEIGDVYDVLPSLLK